MTQVREQTESGSRPGCMTQRPRASSPKRGKGDSGGAHWGLTWVVRKRDVVRNKEKKDRRGTLRDRSGQGRPPHPSFWSGFSCRPESRRMRQSSYLSRVPEAPAAR